MWGRSSSARRPSAWAKSWCSARRHEPSAPASGPMSVLRAPCAEKTAETVTSISKLPGGRTAARELFICGGLFSRAKAAGAGRAAQKPAPAGCSGAGQGSGTAAVPRAAEGDKKGGGGVPAAAFLVRPAARRLTAGGGAGRPEPPQSKSALHSVKCAFRPQARPNGREDQSRFFPAAKKSRPQGAPDRDPAQRSRPGEEK